MNYFAGFDIGGTNGRFKVISETGALLGDFLAPGFSANTDGYEKSRQRCRDLVLPGLLELGLEAENCMGICAAISGIDSLSISNSCRNIFEEMGFSSHCLKIVNDCEIFLYLSKNPSMVLVSGTGSVCYGLGADKQVYRTGGWNHIVSDEGSGFDLGLRILQAVANDLDGRKETALLTSMVKKESGLDTLEKLNEFINDHLFEKAAIAGFAKTGYQAALSGDRESLKAHHCCAQLLYQLVEDTYKKMDSSMQINGNLWLWGSVLVKNNLIRQYLSKQIQENLPTLKISIPDMSALDVALEVAAGRL